MSRQPRDEKGNFLPQKVVTSEENKVTFHLSEFECRVIGNRLHRAGERLDDLLQKTNINLAQDCKYWSRRFLNECSLRENKDQSYYDKGKKRHIDSDYHIKIEVTDYECWSIGNRQFLIL